MFKFSGILFFLLFVLGMQCYSQNEYLNKTFVIGNQNKPHTIIPTDSGYVLACWYRNAICLVDSQANIKWYKTYTTTGWSSYTGDYSPNALVSTGHNTFFAGGVMQNSGPSANKNYSIKYSETFDTIYQKLILQDSITLDNHVKNSFLSFDGNYIFLGSSGYSGMIICTDSNSNFIDSTLILKGTNDYNWFNSGLQMGNNYYLFGATRAYAPAYVIGFDRTDGWVVKTDTLGNEITSAAFGNPELFDTEFIFCLRQNNYILTAISSGESMHSSGAIFLHPKILILNENLNVIKEVKIKESFLIGDTMYRSFINQIVIESNNNYFVLMRDNKFNVSAYTNTNTSYVVKLDSLFNICYNRNYTHLGGKFDSENSTTITTTSDGGYIFGGYVYDNTLTPTQQAWLVKTDSLGCDGFHSCDDTLLVCNILQAPDTACKNDTAWIHVKFKGRSAPYFIYANSTLALDSVYYPYTLPLWIDTLVPYVPTTLGIQQVIIKVQDPWGWYQSDTVQVFVKNCGVGVLEEDWYPKKVEIYPNPASTEIRVRMRVSTKTEKGGYIITLYNMQGIEVKQITTIYSETVIDVSGLEKGVYGVRVLGNNINVVERFVKL